MIWSTPVRSSWHVSLAATGTAASSTRRKGRPAFPIAFSAPQLPFLSFRNRPISLAASRKSFRGGSLRTRMPPLAIAPLGRISDGHSAGRQSENQDVLLVQAFHTTYPASRLPASWRSRKVPEVSQHLRIEGTQRCYVSRGTPLLKLSFTASSVRTGGVSISRTSDWKIRAPCETK